MKEVSNSKTTNIAAQNKSFFGAASPFFSPLPVLPKLAINQPNDELEREADLVADKVMRKEKPGSTFFSPITIQRKCDHCEEEDKKKLQKKENNSDAVVDIPALESYTGSLVSKGAALPNETRNFFESGFGYDFSDVRIHTDSEAVQSANNINALAYTVGHNIVFNNNQFAPSSESGKRLLAHELTHVVQQGSAVARKENKESRSNEMIPGYTQDHALHLSNTPGVSIQRAKIDHRDLVWADFQGKAPKKSHYDAATNSGFTAPDLSLYPFTTLTEVENGTVAHVGNKDVDCTKGMSRDKRAAQRPEKYKAYKVNIEPDLTPLVVKAYMWQEKSWAMPWTHDAAGRTAYAAKHVTKCENTFNKIITKANKDCKKITKQCEKAFKKNANSIFTYGSDQATSQAECASIIEPACITDRTTGRTYTYSNQNGVEASASQLSDCTSTFQQELENTVLEDSSTALLNHEQRHFDITHQLAEQMTTALQNLASGFAQKEVEACSSGKALRAAAQVLKKQRTDLKNEIKPIKASWQKYQNKYDSETKHGTVPEAQAWWGENIDAGLLEKSGKGKF